MPGLHADLGGAVLHRLAHAPLQLRAVVLVGVGGALALAEAAERAPDRADVRDVDVPVHDEGHGLARQLAAQLVGGLAHVLDRLGPCLREQSGELLLRQRRAIPALGDRARHQVAADLPLLAAAGAAARDEAPVARLDHVEHALLDPAGVHVLRIHAEALGEGVAARRELLAHPVDRRERVLGRDVVAVRGQPAEVGGALVDEREPPVGEVRRYLDAHVGHQPARLAHERPHVVERHRRGPRRGRERPRRACRCAGPRRRSRRAPRRSSADAERSSGGSPPGGGRARRAPRPAPRAPPRARPASPRCPRGCRW